MSYDVYKLLVMPLLATRPGNIEEKDWLDWCWATNIVVISRYHCKRALDLPGLYMVDDTHPTYGLGDEKRGCKRYQALVVRGDDRFPNSIIVDHRGANFLLNKEEWLSLRTMLKLYKQDQEVVLE